jgi:hypothetical protein
LWDIKLKKSRNLYGTIIFILKYCNPKSHNCLSVYLVFRGQADWTMTHTSHKDTEQSTIEASITLDGATLTDTDQVITERMTFSLPGDASVCR